MRRPATFRLPRRPAHAILLTLIVLVLAALQQWRPDLFRHAEPGPAQSGSYHVARVVDGDTLVLSGVKEHVRLIGADTPETVKPNHPVEPCGPEATAFTREFLSGGQVRVELDSESRDKYGRLLAYIWVGDRMLNEELIRAGLARAELQYHYSNAMKVRFRRAESEAKSARRGIWSGIL